ncbi:predicted protein [Histoplasma capsulatum G186AR]|uniref:Uncharacterized protein n=1 Tax=Ajellomyces capsulatus (strain G186AR / H82 / ATCC MYA-2454 / RMSCC 2432) TaxID=447093 RepID=C0NV91_AJECG|nr:uncharacterized protein HCBG_07071 [Histoplasma capsulatum G186AR]EEH04430.1 predicted protein [Histoplasma capsulatum G186AR]
MPRFYVVLPVSMGMNRMRMRGRYPHTPVSTQRIQSGCHYMWTSNGFEELEAVMVGYKLAARTKDSASCRNLILGCSFQTAPPRVVGLKVVALQQATAITSRKHPAFVFIEFATEAINQAFATVRWSKVSPQFQSRNL